MDQKEANQTTKKSPLLLVGFVLAIGLAALSFATAKQNQNQIQELAVLVKQQIEVAGTQNQPSSEEIAEQIRQEIEQARRDERQKPYRSIAGKYDNAVESLKKSEPGTSVYGAEDAEVTIIEFSDFDCPYCKRFHDTPKSVVDSSNGRVNWVWKHFPVHASARPLHVATECVSQQSNRLFWIAAELIFNEDGSRGVKPHELGEMLPIDQQTFEECLSSREAQVAVQEHYNFGQEAGVTGTPATFVIHNGTNQVLQLKGAVPRNQVEAAIRQLIESARNPESPEVGE